MTVALHEDDGLRIWPLPEYEPDEGPRRWSSLRPATGPQLRLVAAPQPAEDPPVLPIPPAELWHVLRRVLEVLDGRRPVGQLRALLPDAAFEGLLTRLRSAPSGAKHTMKRLHTCSPAPAAVEVSAVVQVTSTVARSRYMAAAARFEKVRGHWRCAVLRFL